MHYMYSGDTLIVDLDSGEIAYEDFDFSEGSGPGILQGLDLFERFSDSDPLVIGSGLLTGTSVPGSCLGFILSRNSWDGGIAVTPLNLHAGAEVKLSGFGIILIRGQSGEPVYLWLHDGVADVLKAEEISLLDTWETTDFIRREMGEKHIQVISAGSLRAVEYSSSSVSINYWGSFDTTGCGEVFAKKNLKAVAVRGLGIIDAYDPWALHSLSVEMVRRSEKRNGFSSIGEGGAQLDEWIKGLVHRHRSCFSCPFACFPFVKYNETPESMTSEGVEEPGLLLTSYAPLALLIEKGFDAEDACRVMEVACRKGANQLALALALEKGIQLTAENVHNIAAEGLSGIKGKIRMPRDGRLTYNSWFYPELEGEEWLALNHLGFTLGVCPLFLKNSGLPLRFFTEACAHAAQIEVGAEKVTEAVRAFVAEK